MGFATYFLGLGLSVPAAIILRGVLGWGTRRLGLRPDGFWKSALLAAARALPFAFAFAPAIFLKRGLGVLLPAVVYPFPEILMLPFRNQPLDIDDQKNLPPAVASFIVVWLLASFVLLVRQVCKSTGKIEANTKASN